MHVHAYAQLADRDSFQHRSDEKEVSDILGVTAGAADS
jgi:hypothetical protein